MTKSAEPIAKTITNAQTGSEPARTAAKEVAIDTMETAQLHAMELQDQIGEFVKRQPVASLGLAVGAGVLVGVLTGRRS